MIRDREVRILFRKEWRQLVSNRAALATGAILPVLMLGVMPQMMGVAARAPSRHSSAPTPSALDFGLFGEIGSDVKHLPGAMLPLFVAMVGMILPTMMASYLLITERERRTLELLVALPVRIEQVLIAKLGAVLLASSLITVPVLVVDMITIPATGGARAIDLLALPVELVSALAFSTSAALLMSLLAKDFRTANNVAGLVLVPALFIAIGLTMVLPGGVIRPLVISAVYLLGAAIVMRIALKTVTFERMLA